MSSWLPPRVLRRAVLDPLWFVLAAVLALVLTVVLILAGVLAPFTKRRRVARVVALALVYLWMDVLLVVKSLWLWLRNPRLRTRDESSWRAQHADMLGVALTGLMTAARRLAGYQVEFVGATERPDPDRPLIVLARHAGPGDSFTLVHLLVTGYRRCPRVVLEESLQWDPGLDVVLTRLACYFLPSRTGAGDDRADEVAALAGDLSANDALLLFPEGGNWTPRRHRRAVVRLLRRGRRAEGRRVRERTHVLPPRPAGTASALAARTDADVLVIAHCGLDTLVNPGQLWRALPFDDRPMRVRSWLYPADTVPRSESGVHTWLEAKWADIDQWVDSQQRHD